MVSGEPAFRSVTDLPGPPDAAFVAVPAPACPPLVAELAAAGCGGAVVYSSGFAETGRPGADRQRALTAAAGAMPLLGPNCYGLINYADRVAIWPDQHGGMPLPPGERGVALVAQSSSIAISATMVDTGLPLSHVLTVGNGAQIGVARAAAALLDADRVSAVGLILESLADVRGLERLAARARARRSGMVALVSAAASRPAARWSATPARWPPSAAIGSNFLRRIGIGEVSSVDALLGALGLLHCGGPLTGTRLGSLSCSGGEAALVADAAHGRRARFEELTDAQRAELASVLGERVALANPLDYHTYIWGDVDAMTAAFAAMVRGPADLNLLFADLPRADRCADDDWQLAITAFRRACTGAGARGALVAAMAGNLAGARAAEWVRARAAGARPARGRDGRGRGGGHIGQAWAAPPAPPAPVRPAQGPGDRAPVRRISAGRRAGARRGAAKDLLRRAGVPVPPGPALHQRGGGDGAAAELPAPFVVKGLGVAHKTEHQAVRLGLADPAQVAVGRRGAAGPVPRGAGRAAWSSAGWPSCWSGSRPTRCSARCSPSAPAGCSPSCSPTSPTWCCPSTPPRSAGPCSTCAAPRCSPATAGAAPADLDGLVAAVNRVAGVA